MVTFTYNSDIKSYKTAFDAKPLEVKVFTIVALIVSFGSIILHFLFFRWFLSSIDPFVGSIGLWLYINPVIVTIFNKRERKDRPVQMGIIVLLAMFILFGLYDLHPDQFQLHTTTPGLRVSPYKYLVSMVMPAIWIVVLAIRPIANFIQQRRSKPEEFITA